METKINIMKPFFEDPARGFFIRELSRILKINHTTVRQHLNKLVKEGLLILVKTSLYPIYKVVLSREYFNLKLFYNIEKLRKSGIIEDLQAYYDYPVIVLFGSYAKSLDDLKSDIDLCLISDIKKEYNTKPHESILNRKVSIHHFTKKSWSFAIKKNPALINSICNGIVLSGELEVLK